MFSSNTTIPVNIHVSTASSNIHGGYGFRFLRPEVSEPNVGEAASADEEAGLGSDYVGVYNPKDLKGMVPYKSHLNISFKVMGGSFMKPSISAPELEDKIVLGRDEECDKITVLYEEAIHPDPIETQISVPSERKTVYIRMTYRVDGETEVNEVNHCVCFSKKQLPQHSAEISVRVVGLDGNEPVFGLHYGKWEVPPTGYFGTVKNVVSAAATTLANLSSALGWGRRALTGADYEQVRRDNEESEG